MSKKMKWMLVLFFLLSLLLIGEVSALGVAPGKNIVDFAAGEERQLNFMIINNDKQSFKALISVEGDLAEYITLYDSIVSISADEDMRSFKYKMNMPENLGKPGIHEARIVITLVPDEAEKTGTHVGAYPTVVSKVQVRVPYPNKYADASLDVRNTDVGEVTEFVVSVSNFGTEDINEAKAYVVLYDQNNEKVLSFETSSESIKPNQLRKLVAREQLDLSPGPYTAVAVLEYDGIKQRLEKEFEYGSAKIDIKDISLKDFNLGKIVQFDILLQSLWGQPIEDVFAEVIVRDPGRIVSQFKTVTADIPPLEEVTLTGYWNTAGVDVGDYFMDVLLHHGDKVSQKSFNISVSLDDASISSVGKVIGADEKKEGGFSVTVLTLLVIALIAVNVILFIYFRRMIKKRK